MNKKFKLFSTIASLCLAVALMAFGVWAANASVKFNTSSSVSFTATTDVYGTFRAEVKKGEDAATDVIEVSRANVAGAIWGATSNNTNTGTVANLMGDTGVTLGSDLKLSAVGDKYTFTYTFTNASPYALSYTLTNSELSADVMQANKTTDVAIDVTDAETAKTGTVAVGGNVSFVITVELKSLDIAADTTINVPFQLELVKASA